METNFWFGGTTTSAVSQKTPQTLDENLSVRAPWSKMKQQMPSKSCVVIWKEWIGKCTKRFGLSAWCTEQTVVAIATQTKIPLPKTSLVRSLWTLFWKITSRNSFEHPLSFINSQKTFLVPSVLRDLEISIFSDLAPPTPSPPRGCWACRWSSSAPVYPSAPVYTLTLITWSPHIDAGAYCRLIHFAQLPENTSPTLLPSSPSQITLTHWVTPPPINRLRN